MGTSDILRVGDVTLDLTRKCVIRSGRETHLTPKQCQLLEVFMRRPGEVLNLRFLMQHVWQTDYLGNTHTLEVHIYWLRQIIEDDPHAPRYLRTVPGIGYRFSDEADLQDNAGKGEASPPGPA